MSRSFSDKNIPAIFVPLVIILTIIGSVIVMSASGEDQFNFQENAIDIGQVDTEINNMLKPGATSISEPEIYKILQNNSWEVSFQGKNKTGTINFSDDGKFSAFMCNDISGSYEVDGGNLKILNAAMTKKFCGDSAGKVLMDSEAALASAPPQGFKLMIVSKDEVELRSLTNNLQFKLQRIAKISGSTN